MTFINGFARGEISPLFCGVLSPRWWLNHPFEKYAHHIGSFPQVRGLNKKIFETTT